MTDFANLTLGVDSRPVKEGVAELDKLTAAGARAETAATDMAKAQAQAAAQISALKTELAAGRISQEQFIAKAHGVAQSLASVKASAATTAAAYNALGNAAATSARAQQTSVQQVSAVMKATTVSAGQMRAGMQQLSFQIGDVAQQFALGAPPMRIFAAQASQVVQAIGLMSNSSKGLIGFLSGPWGAVMLGAVTILGSLFAAHSKAADGADTQAQSAEDLTKALNDLHDAAVKETQSAYAQAAANIAAAESHRTRAIEARKAAIAELQLAKAAFTAAQAELSKALPGKGGVEVAVGRLASADRMKELNAEIEKQNKLLAKGDEVLRIRQGQLVNMKLEEALDKGVAATGKFNRAQDALNKQLRDGSISLDDYAKKSLAAMQTRDREEEAARKSDKAHKEKKKSLTDEQRAYQQAVKSAENYIESLELEIEKTGKTAAEIRQIDIAHAKAAAPTAALKAKIDELNVSREKALGIAEAEAKAKERKKNDAQLLEPIKEELALLGLTGEARDKAALKLEFESQMAKMLAGDLNLSAEALQNWYDTSLQVIEGESALEREARAARDLQDALFAVADQAQVAGEIMSNAFGKVGDVLGGVVASIAEYQAARVDMDEQVAKGAISRANADKRLATLEARNTAMAISGVKSLFKEKSTAYKVLTAIEMAYAAMQVVNTIKSIAMDTAKTGSSIANSAARATADGVAAVAKAIASLPFPLNLAAGAATAAALVAFGVKLFGGGGGGGGSVPTTAEDLQEQAGTGSVLGDAKAKSNSIANSLEIVAANTNKDLEYSNQMLAALRNIDTSIAKMAGTVARQIQVSGSLFDTSKLKLGSSGSGGFLGIGASSTTRTLWDLGINLQSASVADIIANGIAGNSYQVVQKIKKKSGFLGIGGGTKTSYKTTTGALDPEIVGAIQEVVVSLRDGLLSAADVIGLQGAEAILNSFNVSLGKISFKDMTGEQIEEQLNAIFSKVGDDMAGAIFPALKEMQLIGEGLFETFIRVAREYEVVDIALKSIGRTFGMVGVESVKLRDNLVQLFGGLEEFVEATTFFRDEFLTEVEQITPIIASVKAEMARLGLASVDTREEFKAAVLGLDLTTQAGRDMYAALLNVAPAFDKVLDYYEQANKALADTLQDTADKFNGFASSLRKYRDSLFATDGAQSSYAMLRAKFASTAALASTGDEAALGGLETAGKEFLTSARNNASSLQDYLRDVALVARGVDQGIFAAESVADYAELQLEALNNSVSILGSIAQNTAATAQALGVPQPAAVPTSAVVVGGPAPVSPETAQAQADTKAALESMASQIAEMNRRFNRWDRGDTIAITVDSDDPLPVNLTSWG